MKKAYYLIAAFVLVAGAAFGQTGSVVVDTSHRGDIWSLAFSPDGKVLAVACPDQKVKLWDVSSGELIRSIPGSSYWVAWHPDGSLLAVGGKDALIRLWDTARGEVIHTLQGHQVQKALDRREFGAVSLSFSPDGTRLASGSDDHTVRIGRSWNLPKPRRSRTSTRCAPPTKRG